jgi:hypothetical protein
MRRRRGRKADAQLPYKIHVVKNKALDAHYDCKNDCRLASHGHQSAIINSLYHSWRNSQYHVPFRRAFLVVVFIVSGDLPPWVPPEQLSPAVKLELQAMPPPRHDLMGNEELLAIRHICQKLHNQSFTNRILNKTTPPQHLWIITERSHRECGMREISPANRTMFGELTGAVQEHLINFYLDNLAPPSRFPTMQLPYAHYLPSASESLPWQVQAERPYLTSLVGSNFGNYVWLRTMLARACDALGKPSCLHVDFAKPYGQDDVDAAHRSATFCLEPPGFGITRKSTPQCFEKGCIPVVFFTKSEIEGNMVYPHYGARDWYWNATVNFDRDLVKSGKIDVWRELRAIPRERIESMRRMIAAKSHALMWPQPGDKGREGDAADMTMRALYQSVESRAVS